MFFFAYPKKNQKMYFFFVKKKQKTFTSYRIIQTFWKYTKTLTQIFLKYRMQAKAFYSEITTYLNIQLITINSFITFETDQIKKYKDKKYILTLY